MTERFEVRIHDFLIEGRDEEKSQVILEIAKPAENEIDSHGFCIALAELTGATPKTIQMVRAWINFALDTYYTTAAETHEQQFEDVLAKLNTQSSLYLKQHAHDVIHLLLLSVRGTSLVCAAHGAPAALMLYESHDAWRCVNLVDPSEQTPGQLFSHVTTGVLRAEDRFAVLTPRVNEFFSPDRLCKISEGKSIEEVAAHMERVLNELASDFSFAGAWIKLARTIAVEQSHVIASTREKRSITSMTDLMHKTKSTAVILSPPVLRMPRDKIVTTILHSTRYGIVHAGRALIRITQKIHIGARQLFSYSRHAARMARTNFKPTTLKTTALASPRSVIVWLRSLPRARRVTALVGIVALAAAVIALIVGGLVYEHARAIDRAHTTIAAVQSQINDATHAFTYQDEPHARQLIADAQTTFDSLPANTRGLDDARAAADALSHAQEQIYRQSMVQPDLIASGLHGVDLTLAGAQPAVVLNTGDIVVMHGSAQTIIGTVPQADHVWYEKDSASFVTHTSEKIFKRINSKTHAVSDVAVSWLPEQATVTAATFYVGRLYAYDAQSLMVYRYDGSHGAYGAGKKWITDSGKPTGVVALAADTSLWMLTDAGNVMKFTAGKLQAFSFSGIEPALTHVDQIVTASGTTLYFLDREHGRIVATDRNGTLVHQFLVSELNGAHFSHIAIDDQETTVFGLTDDGRLMKFNLK